MRRSLIVGIHWILWTLGFAAAYLLRFEGVPPEFLRQAAIFGLAILIPALSLAFWATGLFHGMFRYAGVNEVRTIVFAVTVTVAAMWFFGVAVQEVALPRSIYAGTWLTALLGSAGLRLAVRIWHDRSTVRNGDSARRAVLVGGGDAGEALLRDLDRQGSATLEIRAILDDDPSKRGASIRGKQVAGGITIENLRELADEERISVVILAMPSAPGQRIREILSWCHTLGLDAKTLPSLGQIADGSVSVSKLRDVAIEDLLRRAPVQLDERSLGNFLHGKRVLITGAAGSIGSELGRQVVRYGPSELWLLDHNENGLFFLERELLAAGAKDVFPVLASIRDRERIQALFRSGKPQVVLHAAAHKHVPLMEQNPTEAVKNNVLGTQAVADAAEACGVDTLVLVSTDKAVRPTSVMGATKRIAEVYLQALAHHSRCRFITVRFGNVLGSAGSVVQIFRQQIAHGGPLTVTDELMTRYFMTISEACQLVLQAGAISESGFINILDMGEPVRILDLARDMVRLSGLEPGRDIEIKLTGIRPGEKLFEELQEDSSASTRRLHPKILLDDVEPWPLNRVARAVMQLSQAAAAHDDQAVRAVLSAFLPDATLTNATAGSATPPELAPGSPAQPQTPADFGAQGRLATRPAH